VSPENYGVLELLKEVTLRALYVTLSQHPFAAVLLATLKRVIAPSKPLDLSVT